MNLGENIFNFRVERGMSQGDLANELEVSRQSVSKWENNSAIPELDKLLKMSALFAVTLDELVKGPDENVEEPAPAASQIITPPVWPMPSTRIVVGMVMLFFSMIFFLLSIFWGNHLVMGEEMGEFISITMVLLSISLLATHNHKILAACAVIYMMYSVLCFGILHVQSLHNYFFLAIAGGVLFVWFIVWGTAASKEPNQT